MRPIDTRTLDLVQSYRWPGNVRELQNVIERAVVVCETDILIMDENLFSPESLAAKPPTLGALDQDPVSTPRLLGG